MGALVGSGVTRNTDIVIWYDYGPLSYQNCRALRGSHVRDRRTHTLQ